MLDLDTAATVGSQVDTYSPVPSVSNDNRQRTFLS